MAEDHHLTVVISTLSGEQLGGRVTERYYRISPSRSSGSFRNPKEGKVVPLVRVAGVEGKSRKVEVVAG